MIIKWLKSVVHTSNPAAIKQADDEERKIKKDAKLIDVAHEALVYNHETDQSTLDKLVKFGWANIKRDRFRKQVKKKVWNTVSSNFGVTDENMIDEITESITEAAEADPFYKKIFQNNCK